MNEKDRTFMLNTNATTVPALSSFFLAPLSFAKTYSLSSTNNVHFQINTNLNATAKTSQTIYQPQTAQNMGRSANIPSSSYAPTVKSINPSPVITQIHIVAFVAMNNSVETFDGLDHQNTAGKVLHQIGSRMNLALGEQPLDPVAYNHWQKRQKDSVFYLELL